MKESGPGLFCDTIPTFIWSETGNYSCHHSRNRRLNPVISRYEAVILGYCSIQWCCSWRIDSCGWGEL